MFYCVSSLFICLFLLFFFFTGFCGKSYWEWEGRGCFYGRGIGGDGEYILWEKCFYLGWPRDGDLGVGNYTNYNEYTRKVDWKENDKKYYANYTTYYNVNRNQSEIETLLIKNEKSSRNLIFCRFLFKFLFVYFFGIFYICKLTIFEQNFGYKSSKIINLIKKIKE